MMRTKRVSKEAAAYPTDATRNPSIQRSRNAVNVVVSWCRSSRSRSRSRNRDNKKAQSGRACQSIMRSLHKRDTCEREQRTAKGLILTSDYDCDNDDDNNIDKTNRRRGMGRREIITRYFEYFLSLVFPHSLFFFFHPLLLLLFFRNILLSSFFFFSFLFSSSQPGYYDLLLSFFSFLFSSLFIVLLSSLPPSLFSLTYFIFSLLFFFFFFFKLFT